MNAKKFVQVLTVMAIVTLPFGDQDKRLIPLQVLQELTTRTIVEYQRQNHAEVLDAMQCSLLDGMKISAQEMAIAKIDTFQYIQQKSLKIISQIKKVCPTPDDGYSMLA
ncbi:MAG: hypothetical protein WCJ84_04500 [Candidatus Peregrinibacteria bacterium]